jgi:CHAD domain-containing protein
VTEVHAAPTTTERDVQLHEARKAAKKARYAGETMTEFFGKAADRFAKAMETLQEELGEHQDSVVMRTRLEELARQETAPAAAFAYGRLHAQEEQRGQLAVDRFETVWRKATKKSLRSWMN